MSRDAAWPSEGLRQVSASGWSLLALLRFILAAVVAAGHLSWFVLDLGMPLHVIGALSGKVAVIGFFMISGYSVGYSYLTKPRGYLKRRFLRIYPLYSAAVLFTLLLSVVIGPIATYPHAAFAAPGLLTHIANLFFLQNFVAITIVYNSPLWTLSVEVCLYLLLPFLLRIPEKTLMMITGISMIVFALSGLTDRLPGNGELGGVVVVKYAWAFTMGVLMVRNGRREVFGVLALMSVVLFTVNPLKADYLSLAMYGGVFGVLLCVRQANLPPFLRSCFNTLGDISYPLYLFHLPLFMALYSFCGVRHPWEFAFWTLIVVVGLDWILDRWVKNVFWRPLVSQLATIIPVRVRFG